MAVVANGRQLWPTTMNKALCCEYTVESTRTEINWSRSKKKKKRVKKKKIRKGEQEVDRKKDKNVDACEKNTEDSNLDNAIILFIFIINFDCFIYFDTYQNDKIIKGKEKKGITIRTSY